MRHVKIGFFALDCDGCIGELVCVNPVDGRINYVYGYKEGGVTRYYAEGSLDPSGETQGNYFVEASKIYRYQNPPLLRYLYDQVVIHGLTEVRIGSYSKRDGVESDHLNDALNFNGSFVPYLDGVVSDLRQRLSDNGYGHVDVSLDPIVLSDVYLGHSPGTAVQTIREALSPVPEGAGSRSIRRYTDLTCSPVRDRALAARDKRDHSYLWVHRAAEAIEQAKQQPDCEEASALVLVVDDLLEEVVTVNAQWMEKNASTLLPVGVQFGARAYEPGMRGVACADITTDGLADRDPNYLKTLQAIFEESARRYPNYDVSEYLKGGDPAYVDPGHVDDDEIIRRTASVLVNRVVMPSPVQAAQEAIWKGRSGNGDNVDPTLDVVLGDEVGALGLAPV